MLNKEDKPDLFLEYRVELENLISRADDFGWGIQDSFDESYLNLKWLEEYEEPVDGKSAEEDETAEEKWLRIHQDSREKILKNVWCVACRNAVTIVDYHFTYDNFGIVSEGKCRNCGHDVVRIVEMD